MSLYQQYNLLRQQRAHTQTPRGVITNLNADLAPGDLRYAENVVIRRQGLIEPRRSFREIAVNKPAGSTPIIVNALMSLGKRLYFVNVGATTQFSYLSSDFPLAANPTWAALGSASANLNPRVGSNIIYNDRYAYMEAGGSLYFASITGVRKITGTTDTAFAKAGAPRALDITLTGVASTSGFLANNCAVAYRVVWGYVDVNNRLILGWPSGNVALYNTSGSAQNVTAKAFIPTEIKLNVNAGIWNLYVYRTDITAAGASISVIPSPGDLCRLVYQYSFTTTDVANGYVQFTDVFPEGVNKGPDLYTNTNQEGIEQANAQPPLCSDMTLFDDVTFFANTASKHRWTEQMLGIPTEMVVSTGAGGFTKSGANVVVTFTGSPDLTGIDSSMKLAINAATSAGNVGTFPIVSVNVGAFTITATNAGAVTEAGTASSRGIAAKVTVGAQSYHAIYAAENVGNRYFQVTNTGSSQQNVALTMASFIRILNQDASATINAFNITSVDDPAGTVQFEEQAIGGAAFTFQAFGLDFGLNKWLPAAYNAAKSSTNDLSVARLYHSKTSEHEHVPIINYFDIGNRNSKILRLVTSRSSLFIFKEDGLFRLSGDPNAGSVPTRFDDTLILWQPDLAATLHNEIYVISTRGAAAISDAGIRFIGAPIADYLSNLSDLSVEYNGYSVSCWTSKKDSLFHFFVSGNHLPTGGVINTGGTYSATTGAWTMSYFKANVPTDFVGAGFSAPGIPERKAISVADVVCVASGTGFCEMELGYADPKTYNAATPLGLTGQATLEQPLSIASHNPLPGDRYSVSLSNISSAGGGIINVDVTGMDPADYLIAQQGTFNNTMRYFQVLTRSFLAGTTYRATASEYYIDAVDEASLPVVGYAFLVLPFSLLVDYQGWSGSQDTEAKLFTEVLIDLDENSSARNLKVAFTNETRFTPEIVSITNTPMRTVRVPVPQSVARCKSLGVSIYHREAARLCNIAGLTYVYRYLEDPKVTE